jgi:ubiquinone/menaquinone biosynthesis C-methylase UbiE
MNEVRTNLGERSDIDAISAIVSVKALTVIDVGCGPGALARELCAVGARVLAVEPDPIQAAKNRNAPPTPGLEFIEAGAETLPFPAGSAGGVFFCRSLHHVPAEYMDSALKEAVRVLQRQDGFLCVLEPAIEGSYFSVSRPFHDETAVRTQAQLALNRTAKQLFRTLELYEYKQTRRYSHFEQMVARVTGQTFNSIRREQVETDEVRQLFESGRTDQGDYKFEQPMLINLYKSPA